MNSSLNERPAGLRLWEAGAIFAIALIPRFLALRKGAPASSEESRILEAAYSSGRSGISSIQPIPEDPALSDLMVSVAAWLQPFWVQVDRSAELLLVLESTVLDGMRTVWLVVGALACLGVAVSAARLGGRVAGWVGGLILALLPMAVHSSTEMAAPGALLALMSGALFFWTFFEGGSFRGAGFGVSVGLGAAAAPGAFGALLVLPSARGARFRSIAIAALIGASIAALAGAPGGIVSWSQRSADVVWPVVAGSPFLDLLAALARAGGPGFAAMMAAATAWTLTRGDSRHRTVLWVGVLATIGTLISEHDGTLAAAAGLPALVALVAALFTRIGPRWARVALFGFVAVSSVLGVSEVVSARRAWTSAESAEDWIRRNVPNGSSILLEGAEELTLPTSSGLEKLRHYQREGVINRETVDSYAPGNKFFQRLALGEGDLPTLELLQRYNPDQLRYFNWIVLEDDPNLTGFEGLLSEYRIRFRDMVEQEWTLAQRFEPTDEDEPGFSVYTLGEEYPDLSSEQAMNLLYRLARSHQRTLRDTSSAYRDWLIEAGTALRRTGQARGATVYLRPLTERTPPDVEALFQLGLVRVLEEKWLEAKSFLLQALVQDETHGPAHFNLATILEQEGDLLGAETSYRAAVRYLDEKAPAHSRLGGVLYATGREDEARAELERVRRLAPGTPSQEYLEAVVRHPLTVRSPAPNLTVRFLWRDSLSRVSILIDDRVAFGGLHAARSSSSPLRLFRAGAAHRRTDDAFAPRQAPSNLRRWLERRGEETRRDARVR